MSCPRCQAEVEGRFCGYCGAALDERRCPSCGSSVAPGYRFCSECGVEQVEGGTGKAADAEEGEAVPAGAATGPASGGGDGRKAWWVAGAAVAGAVVFLALPYVWTGWADQGDSPRVPMGSRSELPAPGPAPGVDLSTMTPREAADRLFNRVMRALGEGDQEELDNFLPMAIDAYRLVPDLDADGHFHLSLLEQAAGDHRAGLATAERVLGSEPDHLLALYAAGEAARELGEVERARQHFRHALEVFDAESDRDLPEYREHAALLPVIRETARDFLNREGS